MHQKANEICVSSRIHLNSSQINVCAKYKNNKSSTQSNIYLIRIRIQIFITQSEFKYFLHIQIWITNHTKGSEQILPMVSSCEKVLLSAKGQRQQIVSGHVNVGVNDYEEQSDVAQCTAYL